MNLTPYIAKGFPGNFDQLLATVGVAGLDRYQAQHQVRVCPATEAYLYRPPPPIRYRRGARPVLEQIAGPLHGAVDAMNWTAQHVAHPHLVGHVAPDRALSEEALITSGRGWCNEQTRVFVALCEVQEIPARLCFLFHQNQRSGHTAAEVWDGQRWVFFDVTFTMTIPGVEARELSGRGRDRAHAAYRPHFEQYYRQVLPEFRDVPGWGVQDRPTVEKAGDMLETLGICEYWIEGVTVG